MENKNLETTDEDENKKSLNLSRFRLYPRPAHNFVLVWLDRNITDAPDDDHVATINQVRSIIDAVNIFNDAYKCIDYLQNIKDEKAFMIVSGSLGQQVVPLIHNLSKLDSIYVFCGVPSRHEKWVQDWTKIKGVFTQIPPICDSLKQEIKKSGKNFTSVSFVKPTNVAEQNLDQLDQSFMYTQILKEILLEIEYNDQSFKDFISYCRNEYASNIKELSIIQEFEEKYGGHSSIYWYTHPGFIYSMLNRALRTLEIDTIIKMGFFIQDLYKEINKLHLKQTSEQEKQFFIVYRGQGLSKDDFEKLLQAKGGLMSFNNFLSTSKKREISLEFSKDALRKNSEGIGVLFKNGC